MKKLIFPLIAALVLIACKKEETTSTNSENPSDSITTVETPAASKEALEEFSPEQTTQLLQSKNDTLYVTNFFATWCGPCVKEIPHFKEKMEQMKGQPVKFTFVNLDSKTDWGTLVSPFVDEHGIRNQTILLDGNMLDENFFSSNFKTWKGEFIPFTILRKGDKVQEVNGSISKEELENQIQAFQ